MSFDLMVLTVFPFLFVRLLRCFLNGMHLSLVASRLIFTKWTKYLEWVSRVLLMIIKASIMVVSVVRAYVGVCFFLLDVHVCDNI